MLARFNSNLYLIIVLKKIEKFLSLKKKENNNFNKSKLKLA